MSNWNWKVVRQFLKQSFDLGLSRSSCLNYLHRLGFVLKRPKKRLLKAKDEERSLSHRPVGELTNTGVGAMGLKRGRPVQFHWPLVGPQKGRLPLLVPWGLGPAPWGWATAP